VKRLGHALRVGGVAYFQTEGFTAGTMSSRCTTLYIHGADGSAQGEAPLRTSRVSCGAQSVARGKGEGTPLRRGTNKNRKADQSESESCEG
jgi:hypothetical protein